MYEACVERAQEKAEISLPLIDNQQKCQIIEVPMEADVVEEGDVDHSGADEKGPTHPKMFQTVQ